MSEHRLVIGLNAVLAALEGPSPCVLCVERSVGWALPFGAFDPGAHRTFEIGLRQFVELQADVPLGYVEQLYTFGDMGREAPRAVMRDTEPSDRVVSVGYLGLAPECVPPAIDRAQWVDWYTYFPWEDWRDGAPSILTDDILPKLDVWADSEDRRARLRASFALEGVPWEEERVLDRYELLYEAGLVPEEARDRGETARATDESLGRPMLSDHRRILATAIGRLRGKLRYRPILFQMMPEHFTLTDLQLAVEAILGFRLHKQNFRRSLESAGLVEKTDIVAASTGGRPAALYRASALALEKHSLGMTLPRMRQ
ncbi:NUDIX hydrolase [Parvularcula marina]|uniref:NAD regulator n=1 Tax=Parvularcula marina TaxID=2292771 RepID=A0A371RJR0_9PROT|nr:NAD regulator [Parvularcula marina]RFB05679.1 NAD regulator [Parvularcula marina]